MFKKLIKFLLILIPIIFVSIFFILRWQPREPAKPTDLSEADYSYTTEYASYRIQKLMKEKHLPSVAIVLIDDQTTIWQETFGYANPEEGSLAQSDTVYKLWSLAKVFTATEIMRLVEEGLLDLDTPITDYLPDFAIQSRFPESDPITIRSLLTHRSGLPRNGCHKVEYGPDALTLLISSIPDCYLAYPVGYRYKYSNIGFDVLGFLIEKIRREPFEKYMLENWFLPVGMENSGFSKAQIPPHLDISVGYEYYQRDYYPYQQDDIANLPSGNLYSTIGDLGEFLKFIFREGKTDHTQLISAETLAWMEADQATTEQDPQSSGLGWKTATIFGTEHMVWHDGGPSEGIGGLVAFLPERKLGVVIISNSTSFESNVSVTLATDIFKTMIETKTGNEVIENDIQTEYTQEKLVLGKFVGKYAAFGGILEIFARGNQLRGKYQGFTFRLTPINATTFQPGHWLADLGLASYLGVPVDLNKLQIEFISEEETGATTMLIKLGETAYEICPRYPQEDRYQYLWDDLIGDYALLLRYPPGDVGDEIVGYASIEVKDDVLQMSGLVGPILPISETELIILSGPFAGETMIYEPEFNAISHQMIIYIKQ